MSKRIRVVLGADHALSFVYDDAAAALAARGTVTRASFVEPASTYCGGCSRPFPCGCGLPRRPVADVGWVADMAPVGGPLLGTYLTRQEALDGEREWLRKERGL